MAGSAALGFTGAFRLQWFNARPLIEASFALAKAPALCGLLFYGNLWYQTGGYAYLHRDVPTYVFNHWAVPKGLIASSASFNAVVLAR